jgi:VWFA-related protein
MKKTRALLTLPLSLCTLFALAPARQNPQQPAPAAKPPQAATPRPQTPQPDATATPPAAADEDEVVRITSNLVQLDVLVTDKKGNQVTNLRPEDFQVLEDGRPQKITHFSYVTTESPAAAANASATPRPGRDAVPPPPRKLRPEQVRRTIAVVVDDLSISFTDMHFVRQALRKYVDKYVGDGDLVAIMRTSAGAGATQQFTSDRRMLYAAVERVRPYLAGSGRPGAFAPAENTGTAAGVGSSVRPGSGADTVGGGGDAQDELNSFREEYFTVGTLGALRYVVNGMRELPGRKSIILFSPGFRLFNPNDPRGSDRALVAARHLVDLANRASVVIYAVDPRGLVTTGPTAADDLSGMTPQQIGDLSSSRSAEVFETQGGNQFLADQTGGLAFKNSNDILPAPRILEDLRGYYLIGYRPDGETFDRRFHTLSARLLNHPELRARARKGFYGVASEGMAQGRPRTRDQQFVAALLSPVASGGVGMRLTALFTNTEKAGSLVSAQLQVDARDLKVTKRPDGEYEAKLDLLGVTFSDTGLAVDQRGVSQTLSMEEAAYRRALRSGILYTINVPVKKPGAYQLRVALRDNGGDRIGSASQFVEVPDLRKGRLALSGVVVSGEAQAAKGAGGEAAAQAAGAREGAVETQDPQSSPAVRRFRPLQIIDYACMIFNGRTDKAHAQPQLTARVMIYRDGEAIFSGKDTPVVSPQPDPRRLIYAGRVTLGSDLAPGDYALQVVVTDQLRDDKYRVASQWIDFEIVK